MTTATVIANLGPVGFHTTAEVRRHAVVFDEPESDGGTDTAPSPLEGLLAALGACTAMTLRMYAQRKGWPLAGVRVTLSHALLSRADCLDCPPDGEFPQADRIHRLIEVSGELSDDQVARLLEIANRCPVHRVLVRHPVVATELRRIDAGL